jgi:uncharacterized protein (UPF0303 family)
MSEYGELLQSLQREEEIIQFDAFTNDMALDLGLRFVKVATDKQGPITIDICRGRQQIFHYAMSGTSSDNDEWIKRKKRVVNRFGHSSYYVGIQCKSQGTTLQERYALDPAKYAAHGGGFPITIKDVGVVGTVTVSGLPQEEDHKLVVTVMADFLNVGL